MVSITLAVEVLIAGFVINGVYLMVLAKMIQDIKDKLDELERRQKK
jgi:uncharacterized membrane protein (DUF485 family)